MEFHENRARQPFIGFVLLVRFVKKWWLQEQTRRARYRPASGSDQLKSAVFFRHHFFFAPVSAGNAGETFTKFIN